MPLDLGNLVSPGFTPPFLGSRPADLWPESYDPTIDSDYDALVLGDLPNYGAYWKCQDARGGSTLADRGAMQLHAAYANPGSYELNAFMGPIPADAFSNTSVRFTNPLGTIARVADFSAFSFGGTSPFSIEVWVYPLAYGAPNYVIDRRLTSGYSLVHRANGTIRFQRFNSAGGTDPGICNTVQKASVGVWTHLIATYDGSSARIYFNGALDSGAISSSVAIQPNSSGRFTIGNVSSGSGLTGFEGFITRVAVYGGTALSAAQALAHYQAGVTDTWQPYQDPASRMPRIVFWTPSAPERGGLLVGETSVPTTPVVATSGLPWEALTGILATASDPLEALLGLAATDSLPEEALVALAATCSDPLEVNRGLAATSSDPVEALRGLAATASDPWDALRALAATASDPLEALAAIAATKDEPWEAPRGLAASASAPWSALLALAGTGPAAWESLLSLARTAAEPWESSVGLAATAAAALEALAGIAGTRSEPLEALSSASSSAAAPLETLVGVVGTGALPWSALQALASVATNPLEALRELVSDALAPWESLGDVAVTSTAELAYEALQGLAGSSGAPSESLVGVASDASAPLEALLGIVSSSPTPYESLAALAASSGLPLETLLALAASRALPLEALAALVAAGVLPWESTATTTAAVGNTAELAWESLAGLSSALVLPWESGRVRAERRGVGGSGITDAEYRRILELLGRRELDDDELVVAVGALRVLGLLP